MLLVSLQLGRNMWDRGILFSYRKRITQFSYKWNPRAKNADPLNPSRLFGGGGLSTFMQFYCGAWPGTIRHCQVIVKNHCCTVSIYDASSVCRRSLSFLLVEDSLIMIRCRRYAYSSTCSHPRVLFPCIVYTYVCVQHPSTAKPHCFIRHVRSSLLVRLTYAFQYGNGFVVAKNCIVQYRKPGPVQQNKIPPDKIVLSYCQVTRREHYDGGGLGTFMEHYCGGGPRTTRHCLVTFSNQCCTDSVFTHLSVTM